MQQISKCEVPIHFYKNVLPSIVFGVLRLSQKHIEQEWMDNPAIIIVGRINNDHILAVIDKWWRRNNPLTCFACIVLIQIVKFAMCLESNIGQSK